METYLIFTGLGAGLAAIAVAAVIWAVRHGQYDDLETPALRVLTDDVAIMKKGERP